MKLDNLRKNILIFKNEVKVYRNLLMSSLDCMGEVDSNHQKIDDKRSRLIKTYAKLEIYIETIGKNPRLHDGVWATLYPAYDNGLSADIVSRVGPSLDAMLTDLDYIEGKIENISEKKFNSIFNKKYRSKKTKKSKESSIDKKRNEYWNYTNIFWLFYQLVCVIWKHKIISILIIILGLFAIDYALAWKNALWVWNSITGIF